VRTSPKLPILAEHCVRPGLRKILPSILLGGVAAFYVSRDEPSTPKKSRLLAFSWPLEELSVICPSS
jgi:hypothetical protein